MPLRAFRRSTLGLLALAGSFVAAPAAAQAVPPILVRFWSGVPNGGGTRPELGSALQNVFCEARTSTIDFRSPTAFVAFMRANCADFGAQPTAVQQGYSFGARFEGVITAFAPSTYTFGGRIDDGSRFWINGTLVRDAWFDTLTDYRYTTPLVEGVNSFQFDYYSNSHGEAWFTMAAPNGTTFGTVPEPATLALTAAGVAALALAAQRRRAA
jgi:hypothetical protein